MVLKNPVFIDPPGHGRHRWSLVLLTVSVRPRPRTHQNKLMTGYAAWAGGSL